MHSIDSLIFLLYDASLFVLSCKQTLLALGKLQKYTAALMLQKQPWLTRASTWHESTYNFMHSKTNIILDFLCVIIYTQATVLSIYGSDPAVYSLGGPLFALRRRRLNLTSSVIEMPILATLFNIDCQLCQSNAFRKIFCCPGLRYPQFTIVVLNLFKKTYF